MEKELMRLRSLEIEYNTYGEHKGRYTASICYEGEKGAVKLAVSPEISAMLLRFCGDALKQCSAAAMEELEESLQMSIAAAEVKPMPVMPQ